jgi:hypothetical protein
VFTPAQTFVFSALRQAADRYLQAGDSAVDNDQKATE